MRPRPLVLLVAFTMFPLIATAQDLRPFVLPWDDTTSSVTDLSFLSPGPAGADGPVRVGEDGHLYTGTQRLRLFGNNVTGGVVFADDIGDDVRDAFAGRMRKFGYNAVRYHHLEAIWLGRNAFGVVKQHRNTSTRRIDAESLDRLHRWFAAFKRHGLYTNMNLLVSRRFVAADGIEGLDPVGWKLQGTIAMWHPRLIELQKDYARQLLSPVNPHTGVAMAKDPSLATVEINNENGILHAWLGGQMDQVPAELAEPLRAEWNAWLKRKYGGEAALARAWQAREVPLGAPLLEGWEAFHLEQHGTATARKSEQGGVVRIDVERGGSQAWHVQWSGGGIVCKTDEPMTLRFEARADGDRSIGVSLSQAHAPWEGLGFQQTLKLTPQWQTFEYVILPSRADENGRVLFSNMSQAGAAFSFRNLSLRPGGRIGGETTLDRIPLPRSTGGATLTAAQRRDFIAFCMDAERSYFGEMRRFLREELGVVAPIVGTIVGCSPMGVQKEMDAIDTHAYWRHPEFPGRDWDSNNWIVRPDAMVDHPQQSAILGTMLKQVRVNGVRKPHMLTEYDHPAPNPYAAEGPLFMAAYAGLQDYDAIYLFCYEHDFRSAGGKIDGFFDTMNHPTVAANALAAALLFRRGDIEPALDQWAVNVTPEKELDALSERGRAWQMVDYADLGGTALDAYVRRVAVEFSGHPKEPSPFNVPGDDGLAADNGAVRWFAAEGANGGALQVQTPAATVVMGRRSGLKWSEGGPHIETPAGRWATAVLVRLDDPSGSAARHRGLLIVTGATANTDWKWKDDSQRMLTSWGKAPTLIETVPVTVRLHVEKEARAWALDARGQRAEEIRIERAGDAGTLRVGPGHTKTATLWYEVEWE